MRSRSEALIAATVLAAAVLLGPAAALAIETADSEFVIIREGDVLADDLYAAAINVRVQGQIDGDLIAFAAEEVVIDGEVTGSVFALAPRVVVNGSVGESVRVSGRALQVEGAVGGDVVAAAIDVGFGAESVIEGGALVWAWDLTALGTIGQDLEGTQRNLDLAGEIGNDVDVSVNRLRVVGDLEVGGDLGYRSDAEGEGLEQASVGGTIVRKAPLPPNIRVRALTLFSRFLVVLLLTIAALTVAWSWPERTNQAVEDLRGRPIRSWAYGALVVLSPVFLVGLAALIVSLAPAAASFPLLVLFIPLTLAAIGLVTAVSLIAGIPVVAWLGGAVFRRFDLYGAIVAGAVIVGMIWMIPLVGWLVPLVVLPLGLGAWMRGWSTGATEAPLETAADPSP